MKIEVLVSTMNQKNNKDLLRNMKIKNNYVVINQITKNNINIPNNINEYTKKFISYEDKGLSKSRNKAIKNSNADICVIADDDMYYVDNYEEIINNAYSKYKDADIITFIVEYDNKEKNKKVLKEGRVNFLKSMKISSVQITFKRKSIIDKDIKFNEEFGSGAKYYFGEENIFLTKCLRAGLKIYYVPIKIATLREGESTWFKGHTEEKYNISGAVYYEMSKYLYPVLIIQFVLRKKWLYGKYLKPKQVLKYMFDGVKKYKKELKKKIYYMGDFCSNTGPAIVNKNYYLYMKEKCFICRTNNKLIRLINFLFNIEKCEVLLVSGLSKFHLKASKVAKNMNKKVVYLMHGYNKVEYELNEIPIKKRFLLKTEESMLQIADKVICVSEKFCEFMKKQRNDMTNKFEFVNNGIEINYKNEIMKPENKEYYTIISVGGGMKRKNNLVVCEAISKIVDLKIKFIIIGKLAQDGNKIKKYDFVEYYENLSHDEVLNKMKTADLYVQNSYFDTFGLAVVEAISMECDILLSKNMGVLSIIDNIDKDMIIQDNEDVDEIKDKIEKKIKNKKKNSYINDFSSLSWKEESKKLLKLLLM